MAQAFIHPMFQQTTMSNGQGDFGGQATTGQGLHGTAQDPRLALGPSNPDGSYGNQTGTGQYDSSTGRIWGSSQDPRANLGQSNPDGSYGPQQGSGSSGPATGPNGETSIMPGPAPGQNLRRTVQQRGNYTPFRPVPAANMIPEAPGEFADQPTVGAEANPADYESVQGFADQAYEQARRNIDPMQDQARRRTEQDLINRGVDPSSPQGMAMLDQQSRNFTDQDNSATFGALQFGQGMQAQMFGQDFQNTVQAGNMQLGNRNADNTRYGIDRGYSLGMGNLDVNRQGQDFNQMMGLEGNQFRNRAYNDSRSDYQDALTMSLMGMTPIPGYGGYDPTGLAGTQINNSSGGGMF